MFKKIEPRPIDPTLLCNWIASQYKTVNFGSFEVMVILSLWKYFFSPTLRAYLLRR